MLVNALKPFSHLALTALFSLSALSISAYAQEAPVADTATNPVAAATVVILETNRGDITLELFDSKTPATVKNFTNYVKKGFYTDTVFHRVIPGYIIQGGGFSKELAKKKTQKPIKNEASDKLKNTIGTVSMARLSAPHTATSQFFINLKDNRNLDYREYNPGYAVFGRVIEGMNIVELIAKAKTSNVGMYKNVPLDAIIIRSAYVQSATATPPVASQAAIDTTSQL